MDGKCGVARRLLSRRIVALRSFFRDRGVPLVVLTIALSGAAIFRFTRPARGPITSASKAAARADDIESAPRVAPVSPRVGQRVRTTSAPVPARDDVGGKIDHVAALRRGLASNDEATRIAAVEAAVSATAIETLADLEKFDLTRDPETAPTVIHAVALLGASAEGPKREEASRTLAGWLRSEMRREGPDVAGNVSNLVEALGDIGGDGAVDALGAALDRADLALHVETLAVAKLGELGDPRARGPVERFAKRVAAMPPAEGIDEELRVEAIAAARTTLSKI